jgi:membrane protease YdiL (CAAX protease family)
MRISEDKDGLNMNQMINSREKPWSMWATAGWGLFIMIVFFIFQRFVYMGFAAVEVAKNPEISIIEMVKSIGMNGFFIVVATLITTPLCISLIALLVKLRKGPTVKQYLGLNTVASRTIFTWLGILTLFALISDYLTRLLGRPIVPEFMVNVYGTAYFVPLLWVAFIVAAPLFEEVFFRGFLFEGFQHSKLGPIGTVLSTSLAWTVLHVQYGAYELSTIFALGIVFGVARLKTQSVYPPLAMHSLFNLFAMVQFVASFGSA